MRKFRAQFPIAAEKLQASKAAKPKD